MKCTAICYAMEADVKGHVIGQYVHYSAWDWQIDNVTIKFFGQVFFQFCCVEHTRHADLSKQVVWLP